MRLEVFLDNNIDLTFTLHRLDLLETATHRYQVGFELRHNILPQASRAVAHSQAEVTNPCSRVLARFKVVFV